MLVLDTDHLTEFQKGSSPEARGLKQRLADSADVYATTIVSVEEIMRGWMAAIRRIHDPRRQINAYAKLQPVFSCEVFSGFFVRGSCSLRLGTLCFYGDRRFRSRDDFLSGVRPLARMAWVARLAGPLYVNMDRVDCQWNQRFRGIRR